METLTCSPSLFVKGYDNRPSSETNDCTVCAWAAFKGISYMEAHTELGRKLGRRNRSGVRTMEWKTFLLKEGLKAVDSSALKTYYKSTNTTRKMTLSTFVKNNKKGRYILGVRGHAVAVIDGVLVDGTFRVKARVEMAFVRR